MKISGYYKEQGNEVNLITNYRDLYIDESIWDNYQHAIDEYVNKKISSEVFYSKMNLCFDVNNIKYEKIFISKVFTDTPVDADFLNLEIVEYGGTGFFYDKAPKLSCEIEHHIYYEI